MKKLVIILLLSILCSCAMAQDSTKYTRVMIYNNPNRFQKELISETRKDKNNFKDGVIWGICCYIVYIFAKDITFKNNLK